MRTLLTLLGAGLILLSLVDLVRTTVAASGGRGPLTSRLNHWVWTFAVGRLGHRHQRHRTLRAVGVLIVVSSLVQWIVLLWTGWTLVFAADISAVREASTGDPAGFWSRAYYTGYAISTMGNGDLVPHGAPWQALTVTMSLTGITVLTLAVTYLVPVVSAVTGRRSLAQQILGLGSTPEAIVVAAHAGGWAEGLERQLERLATSLSELATQHLAYPVLHYFHDVERDGAIAVATGVLDDALTLLEFGVAPESRPDPVTLRSVRSSVSALLAALASAFIQPADSVPPPPELGTLRAAGIPTVDDDRWRTALEDLRDRRRTIHGFVRDDGWTWESVAGADRAGA